MTFSASTQAEIDKLYKGRKHVDLNIGILKDGNREFIHLGPDGKPKDGPIEVYPVGSICKLLRHLCSQSICRLENWI